jgi:hypothetical protein
VIAARILDVILVLLLVAYTVIGWRDGFARTVGAVIGLVVGAVAAFLGIPLLVPLIADPSWRIIATIAATVLLVVGLHAAGSAIGKGVQGQVKAKPLAVLNRIGGAALALVVAALSSSLVLGSLQSLGAPILSEAAAGSWVLRGIDRVTPTPVQAGVARLRSLVLESGLPRIGEALGGITTSPGAPNVDTGTAALSTAARSVVRINGTAYACGQNQSGSGFVVAANRVITNAHVVAGVSAPVVDAPNGQAVQARVVYFDPVNDLAVLAVNGLDVAPLPLTGPQAVGTDGVIDGYPYGGPFTTGGAQVLALSTESVEDIYGDSRAPREIYTLAAQVEPGNSGGPFLTSDGRVAGVVFAENAKDPELGYAIAESVVAPVAQKAATLSGAVEPGHCTKG